ncbi:MAG: hypothetical protein AABW80_05455 [Nanoarchaeota archaeon]
MRNLRSYTRVAFQEHWCDRCCNYIQPGDMYKAHVELREEKKKHRIIVWKYHINPGCDFPEDPEDEEESEIETLTQPEELLLAA